MRVSMPLDPCKHESSEPARVRTNGLHVLVDELFNLSLHSQAQREQLKDSRLCLRLP